MSKRLGMAMVSLAWPVVIVAAVIAILAGTAGNKYELALLSTACINIMVLAGLNLIAGFGGQLALGQAAFVGTGAYATMIAVLDLGWSPVAALVVSPLISAAFALLIGLPSLRLRGLYFAVATLAFGVIFSQLVLQGGTLTGGPDGRGGIPPLNLFGIAFNRPLVELMLVAVIAMVALLLVRGLSRTWFGWGLRASRVSEPGASGVGVSIFRTRLVAFVLSGVLGGLGGSLLAFEHQYVSPSSFTFFASIDLFMVLFLGGLGTFLGPVVGAAILYAFARWFTAFPDAQPFILGAVFLLALRFFPLGIGGYVESRWQRWRTHRRALPDRPDDAVPADDGLVREGSVSR